MVIVLVPVPPWTIDKDAGESESPKLGAGVMMSPMVVV